MLKQNKQHKRKACAERCKSLLVYLPTTKTSPFSMGTWWQSAPCPEPALNPDCTLGLGNLNKTTSVQSCQAKGWGAAKIKLWELTRLCREEQGLAKGRRKERLQQYWLHAELVMGGVTVAAVWYSSPNYGQSFPCFHAAPAPLTSLAVFQWYTLAGERNLSVSVVSAFLKRRSETRFFVELLLSINTFIWKVYPSFQEVTAQVRQGPL